MIKTAEELAMKPSEFQLTVVVNYGTFTIILGKVEDYVEQFRDQNPITKRGRKISVSVSRMLLLTLMYMRQYHTFLSLGQAFSVSESYVHKRYCYIRRIVTQVLDMPAGLLAPTGPLKMAMNVSEQSARRGLKW